MAAIAVILFTAPTMPVLETMVVGVLGLLGPGSLTRSLAAGLAMLLMKLSGRLYAPAGALAVLFVDNPKMQELGLFYTLMPASPGHPCWCSSPPQGSRSWRPCG
uniref:HPP transmembrane region domain-containing protein n=1 Tax=Alexandrium monilatum TaxID=311494 RepID=A0A7S4RVS6_9DINO